MAAYVYSRTESEAATFQLGWRRIFAKQIGAIYLYPSEAKAFIAQWNPDFRFSCILPAQERSVVLNYKKRDGCSSRHQVALPELVLSQVVIKTKYHNEYYCDCNLCINAHPNLCNCYECVNKPKAKLTSRFYLFQAANTYLKPYYIPNIYNDGQICTGQQQIARSLRQANTNLWQSEFNNDFGVVKVFHQHCPKAAHRRYGCFMHKSHNEQSCRRSVNHLCQCPDKLKNLHLWSCLCGKGTCRCRCECACCSRTCQCVCNCSCCRNVCECECSCNLNYEFASAFTAQLRPEGSIFGLNTLCGTEFISTTSRVEGVFVSYDPGFLSRIPEINHVLDIHNQKPMIIGFARLGIETDWEIIMKSGQIYPIFDREICLI